MKNQYFGDINDYKKYGLLRAIIAATDFKVLVNWMLTPDDNGPDGKKTDYLRQPERYSSHDPELFAGLHRLVIEQGRRHTGAIEYTDLLHDAVFFSLHTPEGPYQRSKWFDLSTYELGPVDLVFLDPDNGLEVASRPYGRENSSKYLYWREVKRLWSVGKSLLIYQHFIREKRPAFIQRKLAELKAATPGSLVGAFSTAHVVFLLALQPGHRHFHGPICGTVQGSWGSRIRYCGFLKDSLEDKMDNVSIDRVLKVLNICKTRATYSAVACAIGGSARSLAKEHLGERRPYASWVVSKKTGLPTGYSSEECHPDLLSNAYIIEDCVDLIELARGS